MVESVEPSAKPSTKTTDCPGAIDVTPRNAAALPEVWELSSIFQPVMSTAETPVFVNSNQSALYVLDVAELPLGSTSEMMIDAETELAARNAIASAGTNRDSGRKLRI